MKPGDLVFIRKRPAGIVLRVGLYNELSGVCKQCKATNGWEGGAANLAEICRSCYSPAFLYYNFKSKSKLILMLDTI